MCLFSQSAQLNPDGVFATVRPLWRLLFLQRPAVSAAGSARLLGLSHPAHGLQVCVQWQGAEWAHEKLQHWHYFGVCRLNIDFTAPPSSPLGGT